MSRRLHITIRGAVQGVGFRPFVYRLAREMGLSGWVSNNPQGVFIEAEGEQPELDAFLLRIGKERPPRSFIQSLEYLLLDPAGLSGFEIRPSDGHGETSALVLPDIATCVECLGEIFDPANRRYLYPFTNCTHCGPRFTIIDSLPYDRARTSMRHFAMCAECRREYEEPLDRRFHAQPNACPDCGPQIELWDGSGKPLAARHEALRRAAEAIAAGEIVAVKGLGGFHLVVDGRNEAAVVRLRGRKRREEKPLALMFPSLESIKAECRLSALEERLLLSPESPIVLLCRHPVGFESIIAPSVAPHNPYLGVMLPYTPLHHLLMRELAFPIVATSGNLSDEPICTDEREALCRLGGIADLFLVHNRPILRHVDDSVARVMMGRDLVLRRARGYAPLPVSLREAAPATLAVGGHLKNSVALNAGSQVFISQHIGDLESEQAMEAFRKVIGSFRRLYHIEPERIVCDQHPDYLSAKYARGQGASLVEVQHHYAHVASCMAENQLEGRLLGVAWDGSGYGPDGTIWGGEFLLTDGASFERAASFRNFRLPGGTKAIKEPRRTAIGLLYELLGDRLFEQEDLPPLHSFTDAELALLRQMLAKGINSPFTSSVGRLFDAVASLVGLRQVINFEGQAAMELEFALEGERTEEPFPYRMVKAENQRSPYPPAVVVDWQPMVGAILDDFEEGVSTARIAAKFHNTLTEIIVAVARRVGVERIVLTGGCFQNRYLTEQAVKQLEAAGFRPYWHQRVPPNDGGIALGQLFAASRSRRDARELFPAQAPHEELSPATERGL